MTEFDKNNYIVIKEALEPNIAEFVYNYFLMKRQVARTMFDTKFISPFVEEWGIWNDSQVSDTYSHYGDIAMDTLLLKTLTRRCGTNPLGSGGKHLAKRLRTSAH